MNITILPKVITTRYGLRDKLSELNRNLPMNIRADGLHLAYESGVGIVMNRRNNAVLAEYQQFGNNKYKLVIEK